MTIDKITLKKNKIPAFFYAMKTDKFKGDWGFVKSYGKNYNMAVCTTVDRWLVYDKHTQVMAKTKQSKIILSNPISNQ